MPGRGRGIGMMKCNVMVACSARRATCGYSACLINPIFAIPQLPPIAVVITRDGVFLEPIFAILSAPCVSGETSHFKRIRNWGRKMWNSAKFIALAMSASSGTLSSAFDNAVLNASEMREEA